MSSLTLISGSISEARDPLGRFDPSEVFYTFIEQDTDDPDSVILRNDELPMAMDGKYIEIIQDLGSGKTLKAIDILAHKVFFGGKCYANLGLAWSPANIDKPKNEWVPDINSLEDLSEYNNCTILIDDIYGTIQQWNTEAAKIVSIVANERRKMRKDIIITAQREVMIPPGLRDMATEWIVPVITLRDFTRDSPDGTGYPLELRTIHFNGAKVFKYISEPLIGLERIFEAYNTIETAVHLNKQANEDGGNPNKPGYPLEEEFEVFLNKNEPNRKWVHCSKDGVFDFVDKTGTYAFDVKSIGADGRVRLDSTTDLTEHLRLINAKGHAGYIVLKKEGGWGGVPITYTLNSTVKGKKIPLKRLNKSIRSFESIFGHSIVE